MKAKGFSCFGRIMVEKPTTRKGSNKNVRNNTARYANWRRKATIDTGTTRKWGSNYKQGKKRRENNFNTQAVGGQVSNFFSHTMHDNSIFIYFVRVPLNCKLNWAFSSSSICDYTHMFVCVCRLVIEFRAKYTSQISARNRLSVT